MRNMIWLFALMTLLTLTSIFTDSVSGEVVINLGDNWQKIVDANPAGTIYRVTAGTHRLQTICQKIHAVRVIILSELQFLYIFSCIEFGSSFIISIISLAICCLPFCLIFLCRSIIYNGWLLFNSHFYLLI